MSTVGARIEAGAFTTGLLVAFLWWVVANPLGIGSLLGGLVAFYRRSRPSASGLDPEAVHTVFICIVALPHVVVGECLDQKRGIWYVP